MMQLYTAKEKDWPAESLQKAAGEITWESPSNIALIKYWGKLQGQIPMNPSLSFVLRESIVRITLRYTYRAHDGGLEAFTLNGTPHEGFRRRMDLYLQSMQMYFPFLKHLKLNIHSSSSFPHSAGIASSAAAFSALALCLCELEARLTGTAAAFAEAPAEAFLKKASFMARLGSGSACRSVYEGMVLWGKTPDIPGSSDEYAIGLDQSMVDEVFFTLQDAILVVDKGEKQVSSSAGHAMMRSHPYRESRMQQAAVEMRQILEVLQTGDSFRFIDIIEKEALSLHGLMLSSDPGFILMRPNTIRILEEIRNFRKETGLAAGFTLDAGPNVHLIYFASDALAVKAFIRQKLLPLCQDAQWIDDGMGKGPVSVNT